MRIVRDYRDWPDALQGGAVAIGNFDGLHLGHRAVLDKLVSIAKQYNIPAMVLSFEPHPRQFFKPTSPTQRILSFADKARALRDVGVDVLLAQHFNAAFSQLTAQQFIDEVLVGAMQVSHVLTGEEFIFGHQRGGNAQTLKEHADAKRQFIYDPIAPVTHEETKYSSTRIREQLKVGNVKAAAELLGRPYRWSRRVVKGDQRGRELGFPTANLVPPPLLHPKHGVYAVRCEIEGERYDAIANLGVRPTFDGAKLLLEVHVFDVNETWYGKKMSVEFVDFIRGEQSFVSKKALVKQIAMDCARAREVLAA